VSPHEIARRLQHDHPFRRRALRDPGAIVAKHGIAVDDLTEAAHLLAGDVSVSDEEWGEEHAAMFALIASATASAWNRP